ncbi:MAG: TetR/AcrR family transcriptional regulator [Deltaproteobacteria bacterium]|nr:TetR/AcrR family transcriptional regulator [Deltaproteobacteria bacterium]
MARPKVIDQRDILTAARAHFAEHGYAATSLRQLMAAAGVSTTAFYSRFESKEAVFIALVDEVMRSLLDQGARVLASASSVDDGVEGGLKVLVACLIDHRPVVRLALTEGASVPAVRATLSQAYGALAGLLGAHLASLAGSRLGRKHRSHGWALVGALQIQVMRWAVFDQLDDRELRTELKRTSSVLLS